MATELPVGHEALEGAALARLLTEVTQSLTTAEAAASRLALEERRVLATMIGERTGIEVRKAHIDALVHKVAVTSVEVAANWSGEGRPWWDTPWTFAEPEGGPFQGEWVLTPDATRDRSTLRFRLRPARPPEGFPPLAAELRPDDWRRGHGTWGCFVGEGPAARKELRMLGLARLLRETRAHPVTADRARTMLEEAALSVLAEALAAELRRDVRPATLRGVLRAGWDEVWLAAGSAGDLDAWRAPRRFRRERGNVLGEWWTVGEHPVVPEGLIRVSLVPDGWPESMPRLVAETPEEFMRSHSEPPGWWDRFYLAE